MSVIKSVLFGFTLAGFLCAATAQSQTAIAPSAPSGAASDEVPEGGTPRYVQPETPEQRMARLKTDVDPGPNPDPEQTFVRDGREYTIQRYDKEWARYVEQPGWVRPFAQVAITREIYQENDKYIWVWRPVRARDTVSKEEKRRRAQYLEYGEEHLDFYRGLRKEFEPLELARTPVTVKFEESSSGLPASGSWRNGADVADINRDGFVDLILPPQRGAAGSPAIYLGSASGAWTLWDIEWPRSLDYGTVVAADFNKDRNLDLAFAVHLTGVAVFLHDGKGGFTEVTEGLPTKFPTRRIAAADVDGDGWTDIVTINEGPVGRFEDKAIRREGTLRAYLNRKKGQAWEALQIAGEQEYLGGDYLSVLNLNGDKYPDMIGSTVYFNTTHTLFTSKGKGDWESFGSTGHNVPTRSYYFGTAAGKLISGSKTEDAIQTFARKWPTTIDPMEIPTPPLTQVSGIDRITWTGKEARRIPIVRWEGFRGIRAIAAGDYDGDGNGDIMFVNEGERAMELLLGDGNGGFKRAGLAGLPVLPQQTYDLKVVDVNGDKRLDVVLMYESDERSAFQARNGSVRVYLNRGTERVAP